MALDVRSANPSPHACATDMTPIILISLLLSKMSQEDEWSTSLFLQPDRCPATTTRKQTNFFHIEIPLGDHFSENSIFIGSPVDQWGFETIAGQVRLSRIDLPLGDHFSENSISIGSPVDQWGFETNGAKIRPSRLESAFVARF